jgi:hypothetical protein
MDVSTTLPGSSLRDTSTTQSNNWARSGQDIYYGSGTGNVGIGVTNPQMGLHVADTKGALFGPSGSGTASAYFSPSDENTLNGGYGIDTDGGDIWLNYRGYQDGFTRFRDTRIGNGKGGVVALFEGSTGNVGIGVSSPSTKVHIEQNNLAGATVYNTTYTQLTIENSGSAGIQINSATYGIIYFGDASSPISGQWLYVHSSDTYLWMTAAVTTMSLNATALTVKGDVIAYGAPSDKRLKENIKPIESALDKVSKLQGVTFDWKKQNPQDDKELTRNWKNDIGFIAQDVQKVIPELVRENEDGMLSMRHQGIAPILLEAIKELKQEIDELKKHKCNCKE